MPNPEFYIRDLSGMVKHHKPVQTIEDIFGQSSTIPMPQSIEANVTISLIGDGDFTKYCDEKGNIKKNEILLAIFNGEIPIIPAR